MGKPDRCLVWSNRIAGCRGRIELMEEVRQGEVLLQGVLDRGAGGMLGTRVKQHMTLLLEFTKVQLLLRDIPISTFDSVGSALRGLHNEPHTHTQKSAAQRAKRTVLANMGSGFRCWWDAWERELTSHRWLVSSSHRILL